MDRPYAWQPTIIDVQMLKIGQLIILAVPGEFTTMAGRRIKDAVRTQAQKHGVHNAKVWLLVVRDWGAVPSPEQMKWGGTSRKWGGTKID